MLICVSLGICNPLSHDKRLNQDNAFCFRLSLMTNFSRRHIGCWNSLQVSISALYKCGYQSNVSCNKLCDIAKFRSMAINRIPLGYVNNYDKNRYLEKKSKAAVDCPYFYGLSVKISDLLHLIILMNR